ncbi:MAG: FixH family protein [Sphaerospermopsis sp. SIO1G1]|nr:FixH family protein [Sphaerospermopsis sp. SIO1G1]
MKKLIPLILPISLIIASCTPPSNQTSSQTDNTQPATQTSAVQKTATVALIQPQSDIAMGDTELILEVKDPSSGQAIKVENIEVSSTMPMEGQDPMISKVEIEPTKTAGQFKVKTNFSMTGTWNLAAKIKDAKYKGENKITVQVKEK